jgi:hypothetical protein
LRPPFAVCPLKSLILVVATFDILQPFLLIDLFTTTEQSLDSSESTSTHNSIPNSMGSTSLGRLGEIGTAV